MTRHDPALLSAALAGAERAMNQAIALSPTSHQALGGLSGTLLGVEITTLDLTLYIEMTDATNVRLMTHCENKPDAFVRGTLEDFGALATSDDPAVTLINSGIELQGSSHSLIALQQVVSRMDIDWEAPLVDVLGDVMGHQIARGLRSFFRWGEGARESLKRQMSEYLLEEGRLTPPKAELEHFYDAVQSLAMRVDRAQSQVEKLLAKAHLKRETQ
jgi:ubiquinone biosynthesis protein UbiJ